LYNGGVIRRYM